MKKEKITLLTLGAIAFGGFLLIPAISFASNNIGNKSVVPTHDDTQNWISFLGSLIPAIVTVLIFWINHSMHNRENKKDHEDFADFLRDFTKNVNESLRDQIKIFCSFLLSENKWKVPQMKTVSISYDRLKQIDANVIYTALCLKKIDKRKIEHYIIGIDFLNEGFKNFHHDYKAVQDEIVSYENKINGCYDKILAILDLIRKNNIGEQGVIENAINTITDKGCGNDIRLKSLNIEELHNKINHYGSQISKQLVTDFKGEYELMNNICNNMNKRNDEFNNALQRFIKELEKVFTSFNVLIEDMGEKAIEKDWNVPEL